MYHTTLNNVIQFTFNSYKIYGNKFNEIDIYLDTLFNIKNNEMLNWDKININIIHLN